VFGTISDIGLFEKASNNNGLMAVDKLSLHQEQTRTHTKSGKVQKNGD